MKRIRTTSRRFEQIFGILGSFLSIISGSFILFIESGGHQGNSFIAILSFIGAFLGFISSFYVNKDTEVSGVLFIISAILILIGTQHWGIFGSVMLLIAGMSCLFRK